jgi:hypothetical protein
MLKVDMQGEDFSLALDYLCDENLIASETKPIHQGLGNLYKII